MRRRAVLATLVRQFDVEPNIRRADVEEHRGWIVCELDGEGQASLAGILDIKVLVRAWDEERARQVLAAHAHYHKGHPRDHGGD